MTFVYYTPKQLTFLDKGLWKFFLILSFSMVETSALSSCSLRLTLHFYILNQMHTFALGCTRFSLLLENGSNVGNMSQTRLILFHANSNLSHFPRAISEAGLYTMGQRVFSFSFIQYESLKKCIWVWICIFSSQVWKELHMLTQQQPNYVVTVGVFFLLYKRT